MSKKNRSLSKHKKSSSVKAVRVVGESFSGPIPPPTILAQYDQVLPGSAERILKMAETQEAHRHVIEAKVIKSEVINSRAGLIFGFMIGMTAIISGAIVASSNGELVGGAISLGGLGSLVSVFVYGSKSRKEERVEKEKN